MTGGVDAGFVAGVRAALEAEVRSIVAEAGTGAWRHLQHRRLAERVKALVAAWCDAAGGRGELLEHAVRLASMLRGLQGAGGLFRGGDNVDSPPDSAFSVNDLADAALLLRRFGGDAPAVSELSARLGEILEAVTPALLAGGVHTPNHRWEISAALARLHRLSPRALLAERVEQWLAEGVDVEDGLYSERSANYAAFVSNPSLLTIAEVFDRPELVDAVEQNLDATLDMLLPDGSVETVLSRRQDQRWAVPLAAYLLPLRRVAQLRGRGDLSWAAGLAQDQGIILPGDAAALLLLEPGLAATPPAAVAPVRPRQRVFEGARLLMDHRPAATTVVFGGSDYARHGRIRSGLANSPTFLRMFAGQAVLESVRLSRTFFGLGPFRSDRLTVTTSPGPDGSGGPAAASGSGAATLPGAGGRTLVTLGETVTASYYQPLGAGDLDKGGVYPVGDEGRFSAAMDFGRRDRDDVTLTTTVSVEIGDGRAGLVVDVGGAEVDWALELAFRPGGTMAGARPLGGESGSGGPGDASGGARGGGPGGEAGGLGGGSRWLLDAAAGAARYQVGEDLLCVTVVEASDGRGGVLAAAEAEPGYHPGEEYEFLGGTDAAGGERLYVGGRAPARVRIDIGAYTGG